MPKPRTPSSESPPAKGASSTAVGWGALALAATVIAYLPALRAGFVWNDIDYVTNPALRPLGGLARIWFELGATEQYYPLLHSAFWLQHRIFGDNPAGYHVVNLLLHLGAVILFAAVVRRLLEAKRAQQDCAPTSGGTVDLCRGAVLLRPAGIAGLAAALFALHPVHVATVAWVTEQKNTLSTVFYLAAALAYLRFDRQRSARVYLLASALFVASLLTKTATATLPAALLVVCWWRKGRLEWKRDVAPLLPWLAVGAAAGIFTSWVEGHALGGKGIGAEGVDFSLSLTGRLLLAGRAIWFYLGSLAWPFHLNFIYRRWAIDGRVWWQWLFPLAVIALLVCLWLLRRRSRTPLAVFLLFAGTLFPVLGFVNLYGSLYSRVWDHWQYLADLAPLALAGAALLQAGARAGARLARAGPALGVALCLGFGVLVWRRCGDFQSEETLYRTTLARNPDCWLAHNNLGRLLALTPEGLPEALAQYGAAVRLDPDRAELHYNLANALVKAGRATEAEDEYQVALRLAPDYAEAHNALGNLLARIDGRLPDAIVQFEEALRLTPAIPDIHSNLGIALLVSGRTPDAIAQFEEALRLNPNLVEVHMNLAAALESAGRLAEAKAQFEAALRLRPDLEQARASLEQLEHGP